MPEVFKDYVKNKFRSSGPLKGVRVLEVCTLLFGPSGPSFLAEMGAEVIKIELPPVGDVTRSLNPFGWFYKEQSPMFMHINPNKYYMALDLHIDIAQQIFKELAAKSDIIEFNLRPAVTNRWNIGYEDIKKVNPGIIYIEKNGFGQWGMYAEQDRPSNDGAAQALAGYAWISSFPGRPPLKQPIWICDYYGGLMGEVAVLAALHHRRKTGKGQFIEMSQHESMLNTLGRAFMDYSMNKRVQGHWGNRHPSMAPYDVYRCAGDDRWVAITVPSDEAFATLCRVMGRPELAEDPRYATLVERYEHRGEIDAVISAWSCNRDAREVMATLQAAGVPAAELTHQEELTEHPQLLERQFFQRITHPAAGTHRYPGPMGKFVRNSLVPVQGPAPTLGQHNREVLCGILGLSDEEYRALEEEQVIGTSYLESAAAS